MLTLWATFTWVAAQPLSKAGSLFSATYPVCSAQCFLSTGVCCSSFSVFEQARRSYGTDEDILFVYKESWRVPRLQAFGYDCDVSRAAPVSRLEVWCCGLPLAVSLHSRLRGPFPPTWCPQNLCTSTTTKKQWHPSPAITRLTARVCCF